MNICKEFEIHHIRTEQNTATGKNTATEYRNHVIRARNE